LIVLLIVSGVSGAGKTTVGKLLAERLAIPFFDADDFHPPSNVEKMANGIPLTDADRLPWLETLAGMLDEWEQRGGAVLACSALKESYRAALASRCRGPVAWVILLGPEDVLAQRLASRKGHYFDRGLLRTQLETLEIPGYGWQIDIERPVQDILKEILERLINAGQSLSD
jgi:6-phosphogluconate dehydrogenase/gluconokinase